MTESADLTFSVTSPKSTDLNQQVLVLGVYSSAEGPLLAHPPLDGETAQGLEATLEDLGMTGSADQLVRLPGFDEVGTDIVALIGLGKEPENEAEKLKALRYGAGSAVRQLAGFTSLALSLEAETVEQVAAVAEGAALGAFSDPQLRAKSLESVKAAVEEVAILTEIDADAAADALSRALILGEAVDSTRRLVNTPPNLLYPASFAERAQQRVADLQNVEVSVLDEKALAEEGFGGISGVGQGSSRPPRLVVVRYAPEKAQTSIALVGKGITFDTGGISLKPGSSMFTMKSDMAGAATVLNAVAAAAELELPVSVTAYLCLAENMPSGTAIRPEDVLTMRDGRTVEVLNTDAEGRLVMADGIAYASEKEPDVILDVATLTGAQMVALGTRTAGVMGNSEIRERIVSSAEAAGEDFWPMPLPEHLREGLKSPVADLKNIGNGRWGGMLTAGIFLEEFVGEKDGAKIPWAHLDIAGPSFNEGKPFGFTPKEATGMSLATLLTFIESYA
ncbi:leucyl aminopeptidase [Rothia aerolata]|uniref:Probable cytosol aminopeptidase n=1 Tax=Rothia aerolata TaxID=1812262 RepID=A0A917IM29_9MICC|nr:leucyl aminopeptidase [Rothia aerolata]GGH56644.1 putative cytosol aminopeptidase [Rothia aerolata]